MTESRGPDAESLVLQVLLLPTIFQKLHEKTFYIFGAVNILTLPIVWAFYPESNQRTLEEMDLLFACDSWWTWDAERTFARLREENPELVQAAARGMSVVDPETGIKRRSRGPSLIPGGRDEPLIASANEKHVHSTEQSD
jgi:Sugar (and other) transporter